MKKLRVIMSVLAVSLLFPVLHCMDVAAAEKPIIIKAGHVVVTNYLYDVGLEKFKEIVERETNGQVKVEIYPAGQLGNERELIEGVQVGTIQMAAVNTAPCTGFVKELGVFSLPYLFAKDETAWKVYDGPIGQRLLKKFERVGIKALSFWDGGPRGLIMKDKEVKFPEDLKGLKVRCMEDPAMLSTFKACGAIPTPMAWTEVYTALQQGTVDAVETALPMMALARFYEVGHYLSYTKHYATPAPHIINLKFWNKLPEKFQKIIMKASEAGRDACRTDVGPKGQNAPAKMLDIMAKHGVTVTPIDYSVWRTKLQPTWKNFYGEFGEDFINEILAVK